MTRRTALAAGAAALLARGAGVKLKVAIFSKHLQFLRGEELAKGAAEIGFDAVDITVRKGGHVEPERVKQDLPRLVTAIRAHKLQVPMITTDIVDAETPHAEAILQAMVDLGIFNYRWGGLKYDNGRPYAEQLDRMKPRIAKLAALNSRYKVSAMYHTHSGVGVVGASIWDLYVLLKDYDPKAVGVNFDIGHAVIEGGLGGWINSFQITRPHLRGIAVKDFLWERDSTGAWNAQWKPLGEGMVPFPQFFEMVLKAGFSGPLQLHFEYPLGGADAGKTNPTIEREEIFGAMKRDLGKLRGFLSQAGL